MPDILIPRRRLFFTFALLVSANAGSIGELSAAETSGAPKNSPFMPASTGGAAVVSAAETIEFAGISSVGKRTDLIFHDKTAKKSRWVGVGETVEGISVVSFDPRRDEAVVKINGVQKTLALRKSSRNASGQAPAPVAVLPPAAGFAAPTPLPLPGAEPLAGTNSAPGQMTAAPAPAAPPVAPAVPAGPVTPALVAKQESEARMLVSDLLEIGMAQRKAYEEAHRRAAQGETAPAAGTTPAPGQPGSAPATPGQP